MDAKIKTFLVRTINELNQIPPSKRNEIINDFETTLSGVKSRKTQSNPYTHATFILVRWFRIKKEVLTLSKISIQCEHRNVNREDGCDQCLDCGTRNY